jgi:glycerol-3-phosphate dehydrogenase
VLVGPNAVEVPTREDFTTDEANINAVFKKHSITARKLSKSNIITYFSGIRASTYEEDFVVRKGIKTKNIIEVAGIQSPGITATPAIAVGALDMVKEMLPDSIPNENFNPIRKGIINVSKLSKEKRDELIKKNPDYGVIICRCEEISKGEIIDALKRPLVVPTVDSIKRRLRPSMGRCQGSFCTPLVMQIISDKCNIPIEKVTKGNEKAFIVFNDTKGGD